MRTKFTAKAVASAAVLTLALSGCNDGDDQGGAPFLPSGKSSAPGDANGGQDEGSSSGSDDEGGAGGNGAAAGDGFSDPLALGEPADTTYKDDDDGETKLEIEVEKAVEGSWDDFKNFDLGSTETKGMVPYYVTTSFTSKGGAEPWIPGWGLEWDAWTGPDVPAQGINIAPTAEFPKCPAVDKSQKGKFAPGETEKPCDIFVVPEGKPLYLQWGAELETQKTPLVWKAVG
ncbi:hypothetical protein P8605_03255 [Streptomyces sp. T-3]|nr:hypothetical protein [Streptomyces sp. T-3]